MEMIRISHGLIKGLRILNHTAEDAQNAMKNMDGDRWMDQGNYCCSCVIASCSWLDDHHHPIRIDPPARQDPKPTWTTTPVPFHVVAAFPALVADVLPAQDARSPPRRRAAAVVVRAVVGGGRSVGLHHARELQPC